MKTLICIMLAISALASPTLSSGQVSTVPLTRAQVYADLVRVEQAGYNPAAGDDAKYPADIQAAERRVVAQNGAAQPIPTVTALASTEHHNKIDGLT